MLRLAGGAVEVAPWPENAAPDFLVRPGVATWRVADYELDDDEEEARLVWCATPDEARAAGMAPPPPRSAFAPAVAKTAAEGKAWCSAPNVIQAIELTSFYSMTPCLGDKLNLAAQLARCARVMPQDNDSGGFFVAVLHKRRAWGRNGSGSGGGDNVSASNANASRVTQRERDALRAAGLRRSDSAELLRDSGSGAARAPPPQLRAWARGALNVAWAGCALLEGGQPVEEGIAFANAREDSA